MLLSIMDKKTIDSLVVSKDKRTLILFIFDHLDWTNEYEHLILLQDKINDYIAFYESRQYLKELKNSKRVNNFIIDIRFKYAITPNCESLLKVSNNTVKRINGIIQYKVVG